MSRHAALMERQFIHRATIALRSQLTVDADNQPVDSWPSPVTGVRCRLVDDEDAVIVSGEQAGVTKQRDALLVPAGTAIAPFARVSAVTLAADGSSVDAGPWTVVDVARDQSNVTEFSRATLERVG